MNSKEYALLNENIRTLQVARNALDDYDDSDYDLQIHELDDVICSLSGLSRGEHSSESRKHEDELREEIKNASMQVQKILCLLSSAKHHDLINYLNDCDVDELRTPVQVAMLVALEKYALAASVCLTVTKARLDSLFSSGESSQEQTVKVWTKENGLDE